MNVNDFEDGDKVGDFLRRWESPTPNADAKARLLAALAAESGANERSFGVGGAGLWVLLAAQMRFVHPATWIASLLAMLCGVFVTLAFYETGGSQFFVWIAPIVTALGIAFLYAHDTSEVLEIQLATPIAPRVMLLGRLAVIFAFDLCLAVIASVILAVAQSEISLVPLILSWFVPMTFLSGLAFALSMWLFDPLVSVLISLALWGLFVARSTVASPLWDVTGLPNFLAVEMYPFILALAAVMVAAGWWVAGRGAWALGG